MAHEVFIPKLGANMTEGKIEKWHVKEGEEVDIGDPLFNLVTDKAAVLVEAENRGVMGKIIVPEGTVVPIVTTVAVICDKDEDISLLLDEIEQRKTKEDESVEESFAVQKSIDQDSIKKDYKLIRQDGFGGIKASPKARSLAKEAGIELRRVIATGKNRVVTEKDVYQHIYNSKAKKRAVIIGAGEYSRVVLEILLLQDDFEIAGFLDDNEFLQSKNIFHHPVIGGTDLAENLIKDGIDHFIVTVGIPRIRKLLFEKCIKAGMIPLNAIHPQACISPWAALDKGIVVEAFSVVAAGCIVEKGCFITQNCSISHDCILEEYCHIAPGAHMGGGVSIGRGTLVGVGVSLAPHITVGGSVIITPGSSVDRSIPAGSVVEGVPGRVMGKTHSILS